VAASERQAHSSSRVNYCASRSSNFIDFGTNRKRVYIFLWSTATWTPSCTVSEIRRGLKVKNQHFPYPTPISAKSWGCSLWSRAARFAESQVPKVIAVKLFLKNSNACDHNPPTLQTDRRTNGPADRQLIMAIPRYASHGNSWARLRPRGAQLSTGCFQLGAVRRYAARTHILISPAFHTIVLALPAAIYCGQTLTD